MPCGMCHSPTVHNLERGRALLSKGLHVTMQGQRILVKIIKLKNPKAIKKRISMRKAFAINLIIPFCKTIVKKNNLNVSIPPHKYTNYPFGYQYTNVLSLYK